MSKSDSIKTDMLHGAPGRAMLFFAVPMILGNLFQQLYNIMDSVIVGRYVGEEALASVGASYSITNVFIAIAIGGGIGSSVIASQFLGARQYSKMKSAISTTLINFLGLGILLAAVGLLLNDSILHWMNTPDNVFGDAALYLRIYFMGLPFLFMYNVQASVFNSMGDSVTPLLLLIFSSLLNVILDLYFVLVMDMAVAGVAIATLIAQGVSAVLSFTVLMRKLHRYQDDGVFTYYDIKTVPGMLKIALPSTIQQSIVNVGMLMVQSVVNGFGSSVMAGYAAGTRIESICIVPMLAMGNAMSTFTAQNIGAGQTQRVSKGYRSCYLMIGTAALSLCVLMQLFGAEFVRMFMGEEAGSVAIQTGLDYVRFISFFYIFIGLKATTDGLLRGAGDVLVFTLANLINLSIRVFVAFHFVSVWGVQAVWWAIPMGWSANYLISFCRYLTGKWKVIHLV